MVGANDGLWPKKGLIMSKFVNSATKTIEKNLKTAEEIDLTDIITSLEPGETIADYIESFAAQFEEHKELCVGPTDSQVAVLALRRLAASL
jgi:hypothetical protein